MLGNSAFILAAGGASVPPLSETNLISYLKFEGNMDNEQGSPVPYLYSGSTPEYIDGAMRCDHYNDGRIQIEHSHGPQFSFGGWFKISGNTQVYAINCESFYIALNYNVSPIGYFEADKIVLVHHDTGTSQIVKVFPASPIPVDTWFHVMVTVDETAGEKKLYINSSLAGTGTANGAPTDFLKTDINGSQSSTFPTDLWYDNVVTYDTVLTPETIAAVYAATQK